MGILSISVNSLWLLVAISQCIHGHDVQTKSDLETRVITLEKQGADQQQLIATLLQRLDKQDKQIQIQSQTVEKQQQLLEINARTTADLSSIVRRQGARIMTQERVIKNLRHISQTINTKHDGFKDDIDNKDAFESNVWSGRPKHISDTREDGHLLTTKNHVSSNYTLQTTYLLQSRALQGNRKTGIEKRKRLVLDEEGPVAFHAVIDKVEVAHISINQNIVFDVVIENLRGAYNSQRGVFVAPVNGVYIFSVSITSFIHAHTEVQVQLKKDGVALARAFGHGDNGRHDQGSVTVVSHLIKGNEVWVSLQFPDDDSILGERFSSFTGCLIYQI